MVKRQTCCSHPNPYVAHVRDIINLLKKMEEKKILLQKFVAAGYCSLPSSGSESLTGVIAAMRDEISALLHSSEKETIGP